MTVERTLQPEPELRGEGVGSTGEEERERGEPSLNSVYPTKTTQECFQHHHICEQCVWARLHGAKKLSPLVDTFFVAVILSPSEPRMQITCMTPRTHVCTHTAHESHA